MQQINLNKVPDKPKFKKLMVWFLSVFILSLHIFFSLQNVSSGIQLSELEKQESDLIRMTKELKTRLIEDSSLSKVQELSENSGFSNPTKTIYLTTMENVAKLP